MPSQDKLSVTQLVDRIANDFETAWRTGKAPQIEEFLRRVGEESQSRLLGELLAIEVELRKECGERPAFEDYRSRFSGHSRLEEVLELFFQRQTQAEIHSARDADTVAAENVARSADQTVHPDQIAHYKVERLLGEGGFGRVYLAHDQELDRRVAIKVPKLEKPAESSQAPSRGLSQPLPSGLAYGSR